MKTFSGENLRAAFLWACAALFALFASVLALGCSATEGPTPGVLTVALSTNLTPGTDFDELQMIVKRGDTLIANTSIATWTNQGGVVSGGIRLPGTVNIVNRSSGTPLVTVRFEAKLEKKLLIVREAKVMLPASGDAVLPLLIDWFCIDKLPKKSPTDVGCDDGQTCIAGECQSPDVDLAKLASYDAGAVFGGGTGEPGTGTCFDVLGTFNGGLAYAAEASSGSCGFPWSGGESNVNAAVALPANGAGICFTSGVGGCFVALEKGGASGWRVENQRMIVPAKVCATANARVAVATGKATKSANQPLCGSFSSVGAPDAGTAPTATIVVTDADAGVDASLPDAGTPDATVDSGVDAGTPDATADAGVDAAAVPDTGTPDATVDSGVDAAVPDSGTPDATVDAGVDAAVLDACNPEADGVLAGRICAGRTCNSMQGTDNCGIARTVSCGTCGAGYTCSATQSVCNITTPNATMTATTALLVGDGLDNCGPSSNESCATSLLVSGGTFYRGTNTANPATVSDFRLDKYEVTVGRFRKFVDAWVGSWRPQAGSGKHTHLNSGSGLTNTAGGNEPGWDATWDNYPGAGSSGSTVPSGTSPTTVSGWTTNLSCSSSFQTWTSAAGGNEKRPQNCLSWYDLHAFCIWDGGFLPSEAEWEYAAAGGSEERTYPWGEAVPATSAALSVYDCYWNGTGRNSCSGVTNIANVGSVAAGSGKWGQSDLAGNVYEWNMDGYTSFAATCNNCANFTSSSARERRGGSFTHDASPLAAAFRTDDYPATRNSYFGGRCARTP